LYGKTEICLELICDYEFQQNFDEAAFRSLWEVCANFGVLRWPAPTDQGGHGHSVTTTAYLMEALGYGCNDNGLPFALGTQMWGLQRAILQFGNSSYRRLQTTCWYLPQPTPMPVVGE